MVPYVDQDPTEFVEQQGYVLDMIKMSRDRHTGQSINQNDPQQRHETIADDTRLHDVRVDVESREPLVHVHHGIAFFAVSVYVGRCDGG